MKYLPERSYKNPKREIDHVGPYDQTSGMVAATVRVVGAYSPVVDTAVVTHTLHATDRDSSFLKEAIAAQHSEGYFLLNVSLRLVKV